MLMTGNGQNTPCHTRNLANNAFILLNRLIQEDPQRVTTEWLNRLVQQWMEHGTMPASELLVQLSDYAPLPDASTYDIIVAAIQTTTTVVFPQVGNMSKADWERAQAELTKLTSLTSLPMTPTRISSAWNIFDRLIEEDKYGKEHFNNYKSRLHPDWLHRIVEAWCSCPSSAEQDATEMLIRIHRHAPEVTPDASIYQMIVDTISKKTLGSKREEEMTRRKQSRSRRKQELTKQSRDKGKGAASAPPVSRERSDSGPNVGSNHVPTTKLYNKKLRDLTKKNATDCDPDQAERLLNEMWELYHAGNLSVKPDTSTFNNVLKVMAKSRRRNSGERAEALL